MDPYMKRSVNYRHGSWESPGAAARVVVLALRHPDSIDVDDDDDVHCKLPLLYRAHTIGACCPVSRPSVLFRV